MAHSSVCCGERHLLALSELHLFRYLLSRLRHNKGGKGSARRRYSSRNQTKRRYTRADFARGAVLPRIRAENLRRALPYTAAAQREIYGDFAGLVVGLLYFAQLHSGDRPDINGKESFLCQIQS